MSVALPEFTFEVANLGSVRQGSFTHKPLTIFCGPNNSGKTWTLYSLYFFFKNLMEIKEEERTGSLDNEDLHYLRSLDLSFLFNTFSEQLSEATFVPVIDRTGLQQSIRALPDFNVFLLPAERNGLHLLFRELSRRRTALLHNLRYRMLRRNIPLEEVFQDSIRSPYTTPIADYIDWLNDLTEMQPTKSRGLHLYAEQLKRRLAGGAYLVDKSTGDIAFKPYQSRGDATRASYMGLHMTSSAVKSLFGLWFYLEHQAKAGDLLMIDEPELNLHPESQLKIARLLARLSNAGVSVVISTHSDYIVREFNNLIMLSLDVGGTLREKHHYAAEEILRPEQVGAYLFDRRTIKQFRVIPEDGIYAQTFDDVIRDMNRVNNDIYYTLQGYGDD